MGKDLLTNHSFELHLLSDYLSLVQWHILVNGTKKQNENKRTRNRAMNKR